MLITIWLIRWLVFYCVYGGKNKKNLSPSSKEPKLGVLNLNALSNKSAALRSRGDRQTRSLLAGRLVPSLRSAAALCGFWWTALGFSRLACACLKVPEWIMPSYPYQHHQILSFFYHFTKNKWLVQRFVLLTWEKAPFCLSDCIANHRQSLSSLLTSPSPLSSGRWRARILDLLKNSGWVMIQRLALVRTDGIKWLDGYWGDFNLNTCKFFSQAFQVFIFYSIVTFFTWKILSYKNNMNKLTYCLFSVRILYIPEFKALLPISPTKESVLCPGKKYIWEIFICMSLRE